MCRKRIAPEREAKREKYDQARNKKEAMKQ
jgi:hypothetical protein